MTKYAKIFHNKKDVATLNWNNSVATDAAEPVNKQQIIAPVTPMQAVGTAP